MEPPAESTAAEPKTAKPVPKPKKRTKFRLWAALLGVVVVGAGGYLGAAHLSGGAYHTFGLALGGDAGFLRRTVLTFWEDIEFKDFDQAARYHSPDNQEAVDISYLLQRLFAVKPEALDIMEYEIAFVEVDSTKLRAKVKSRVKAELLINGRIEERELMFFFKRENLNAPWYMELEDSLRSLDVDKKKKH